MCAEWKKEHVNYFVGEITSSTEAENCRFCVYRKRSIFEKIIANVARYLISVGWRFRQSINHRNKPRVYWSEFEEKKIYIEGLSRLNVPFKKIDCSFGTANTTQWFLFGKTSTFCLLNVLKLRHFSNMRRNKLSRLWTKIDLYFEFDSLMSDVPFLWATANLLDSRTKHCIPSQCSRCLNNSMSTFVILATCHINAKNKLH